MAYQREKDQQLYENAAVANISACLAILKQGETVSCFAQLFSILSHGLNMINSQASLTMPQTAPRDYTSTPTNFYTIVPSNLHAGGLSANAIAMSTKTIDPIGLTSYITALLTDGTRSYRTSCIYRFASLVVPLCFPSSITTPLHH